MGPSPYKPSADERNVVMRRMTVITFTFVCSPTEITSFHNLLARRLAPTHFLSFLMHEKPHHTPQRDKVHRILELLANDVMPAGEIQDVPLPTKPGSSLIILTLMRILQRNLKRTTDTFLLISHLRTYSCSNLVAISSLVLELLKNCRVW
jgi:hypothetical protein